MPKNGLEWRYFQLDAIASAMEFDRTGRRHTLIALPTGAGKTFVAGGLIEKMLKTKRFFLILVPRKDLVRQTYKKFVKYFFDEEEVGRIQGSQFNELGRRITIASKSTFDQEYRLQQYLDSIGGQVDLIIVDEAHYSLTAAYQYIIDRCLSPGGFKVGLSATPIRGDRRSLAPMYPDGICYSKDMMELIQEGSLCDIHYLDLDMDAAVEELVPPSTRNRAKVMEVVREQIRYTKTYESWYHTSKEKRTLIFAANIDDARGFNDFFSQQGVDSQVVDYGTDDDDRDEMYANTQVMCNYNVLTTGIDIPEIECIIIARATPDVGLWMQMLGRGTRPAPHINKEYCLVINITDKHHDIITFTDLYGTMEEEVSLRDLMNDEQERTRREPREDEEEQEGVDRLAVDIGVELGQVTAYERNIFLGDGWQVDPVIGDVKREWVYKEQSHQLIAEKSFIGGYQPVHINHKNRRHIIKERMMTLIEAQRACHQYAILEESNLTAKKEREKPSHWQESITEQQLDYLLQRRVPIKPEGWKKGDKPRPLTPDERQTILNTMTKGDYQKIQFHLKHNGSSFSKVNGAVKYQVGQGVVFSHFSGRNMANQHMKSVQDQDIQVTITQR